MDLCLILGNWTASDLRFLVGFHSNADASHKNVELDFRGITCIGVFACGTLLPASSFFQDQLPIKSLLRPLREYSAYSAAVKDNDSDCH